MAFRKKVNFKKSKKQFRRGRKTHKSNIRGPRMSRGGIRR